MSTQPTIIIHHANCPDGFGSAWLMSHHLQSSHPEIVAASYGDPMPGNVEDADVFIVDFCYERDDLIELVECARSVVILDHHQTALGYVKDVPGLQVLHSVADVWAEKPVGNFAVLDMNRSGVGLVQQFTRREHRFLAHIEDRDLWRFALEGTAAVFAAVTSRPYTVEEWNDISMMPVDDLVKEGEAIERFRQKLIADTVATAWQGTLGNGDAVWMAASPYAIGSDVAGELAKRDPDRYAAYFVHYGDHIRFGLRSGPNGADVASIAAQFGGGGHRHAAGFEEASIEGLK